MSITWLVMVLPATFAEVIGLSLVTPGKDGYLHVQVYTGAMFIAGFVCRKLHCFQTPMIFHTFTDTHGIVWALRVCKIHSKEVTRLPEKREGGGAVPADQRPLSMAFAVKACFSMVKV